MFKLIKLGFYALMGYALYELYQGLSSESFQSALTGRGSRDLKRAMNDGGEGRMGALTGEGIGQREETLDDWGTSIPHRVGRGAMKS